MSIRVSLSPRDLSLLQLLSWTPATTALLLQASDSFEGGSFHDERRLRERLQALAKTSIVRSWPAAQPTGGLQNYYKLTPLGFELASGRETAPPPRAFFVEVSPSLFVHTFRLAEVLVAIFRACHARRVSIKRFIRENERTFTVGDRHVQPDAFFRLAAGRRMFNLAFEIDNSTASIDSHATNSIRQKLATYQAYQDLILTQWRNAGKTWERPRLRVVFLTRSVERAYHILAFAAETTPNMARRLVYAATQEEFVTENHRLHTPLFLDHFGRWQSLIDLHPTSPSSKQPVRLTRPVESPLAVW